jgi:hypothetical protein
VDVERGKMHRCSKIVRRAVLREAALVGEREQIRIALRVQLGQWSGAENYIRGCLEIEIGVR